MCNIKFENRSQKRNFHENDMTFIKNPFIFLKENKVVVVLSFHWISLLVISSMKFKVVKSIITKMSVCTNITKIYLSFKVDEIFIGV